LRVSSRPLYLASKFIAAVAFYLPGRTETEVADELNAPDAWLAC
jgi:hypothetical protein